MTALTLNSSTLDALNTLLMPYESYDSLLQRLITCYQSNTSESTANYCTTFSSKAKKFSWSIANGQLVIERDGLQNLTLKLEDITNTLKDLHKIHGFELFPLDNSVSDVKNSRPDKDSGFGRIIYKITKSVSAAQIASQLGPILHQHNILEWNGERHGISFRCTPIVPTLTAEMLEQLLSTE